MKPTTEKLSAPFEVTTVVRGRLERDCESLHCDLERLHDELKLRDSALAATTTHFLIADMRRHGWPIVYVNRAIADDHGYEPGELLGKSPAFLNPSELNAAALGELNRGMQQGQTVRAQVLSRRKDGSTFWAGITLAPIRDAQGQVTHYMGMGSDITARLEEDQRAQQLQARLAAEMQERERMVVERESHHRQLLERTHQLQATNEQYRALLESTSAVPWELDDGTGACRYIGAQVEQQWGWAPELFQHGCFLFSCVHPDDRPAFAQALEDAVASHDVTVECRMQLKSGKFAHVRSFMRHAPGEKGRIVRGISIDITPQKKLESDLYQAQKLESIGRLAAGVAHEINTPVQFVNDNCYFLRDAITRTSDVLRTYREVFAAIAANGLSVTQAVERVEAAETDADLAFICENAPIAIQRSLEGLERVATIVRSMKELSHPTQAERSSADLNAAILSTLTVARHEYKYVADVETRLGELPQVICNVGEFNQTFLNILVNAAHAIEAVVAGSERRGLITVTTQQEGDSVLICVQDTGGGIPESIQANIFDPFFTTKEVGKGTGQGLAIARSVIVDKHHGSLSFESVPGVGTTFAIRLPIDGAATAAIAE